MQALRSKTNIEKKRKKRKKLFILLPVVIIVFAGLFFFYAFGARFHVTDVIVTGSSFAKKDDVEATVEGILSHKLWGFVPQRSSLLIGKRFIEESLYDAYPSIKIAKVRISNGALFVEITEREATSVICSTGNICYFMDNEGFAFALAPQFEGSSFLKIKTYDSDIATGKVIVPEKELQEIIKEIAMLKILDIPIQYVSFTSAEEMELIGPFDTAFIIKRDDSSKVIEERIKALLTSKPNIADGSHEYVDLRIESKIFLKKRES
jgi:hypothetical protein